MKSNEQLIEILRMWNYWDEDSRIDLFSRDLYEKNIKNLRETKEVIVLKGVRRSGKSSLMYLEIQDLIQNGVKRENILFVNFEEPQFMNELEVSLLDAIYEAYLEVLEPKGKLYIFLDEVQNIYGWEKWVLRMYEKTNVQLYVTGSSSKLLSSEFSTALSGRHLSIEVYPLSFKEFLGFKNINTKSKKNIVFNKSLIKKGFKEYLSWGGFPKVLEIESELYKKNELISYYDTIILKDIAKRYEISNISELRELSFYLL